MFPDEMNVLNALVLSVYVALIRTAAYNVQFKTLYVCDASVSGSSLSYHGHVYSDIVCGSLCARRSDCRSFAFVAANSTCTLNGGIVTDNTTCTNGIKYGEKLIKSMCTKPVGNVRLCNGSGNGEAYSSKGRVEVFYDDQWGSVCDDGWEDFNHGDENAKVVCGMFGFMSGVAHVKAAFGQSTSKILLDTVVCNNTETSLLDCSHDGFGNNNCSHDEDVGVVCSAP